MCDQCMRDLEKEIQRYQKREKELLRLIAYAVKTVRAIGRTAKNVSRHPKKKESILSDKSK